MYHVKNRYIVCNYIQIQVYFTTNIIIKICSRHFYYNNSAIVGMSIVLHAVRLLYFYREMN